MDEIKQEQQQTPAEAPQRLKTVGDAQQNAATETETTEQSPEQPDVEKLIAEAEQRGYLRGVNEQIEKRMAQPGLLEIAVGDEESGASKRKCQILNVVRPCVWDL